MEERNHYASRNLRYFSSNGDVIHGPRGWGTEFDQREINALIRFLPLERVAMLEFLSMPYTGDMNHEDVMILDSPGRQRTNDMAYEELLALEDRVGDVCIGLAENTITKCLKIKTYESCASSSSIVLSPKSEQEIPICVICQAEYEDDEQLGGLRCGHEYHTGCIKQWLLMKNVCPICKRPAFST